MADKRSPRKSSPTPRSPARRRPVRTPRAEPPATNGSTDTLVDRDVDQNDEEMSQRRRTSLAYSALRSIRDQILTLRLLPGAAFTESDLAASLGLSKTPVREALVILAEDGLVSSRPGTGYRVAPITVKGSREACHLRTVLEGEAAALAAARPDLDERWTLELEDFAEMAERPYDREMRRKTGYHVHHLQFHTRVADACGNDLLSDRLHHVMFHVVRLCRFVNRLDLATVADAHEGHLAMARAIAERDPDEARRLAVAHAERTERVVVDALLDSTVVQGVDVGGALQPDA